MQIADVPSTFRPKMRTAYPRHQVGARMEEFADTWMRSHTDVLPDDYVYVPVFWDNYHVVNNFGRTGRKELQMLCDRLSMVYRGCELFTVVEYADGVMVDAKMTTFACAGHGDIPIPLLCDAHPANHQANPKYYATFVGSLTTHNVRIVMSQLFGNTPGWWIGKSVSTDQFRFLMDNSRYALCPRGYGPTSYRLFEAIQMGCVPVYIGDAFWLPYKDVPGFDWNDIAVLVRCNQIDDLRAILEAQDANYEKRMRNMKELQGQYIHGMFSHEYAMKYIVGRMKQV